MADEPKPRQDSPPAPDPGPPQGETLTMTREEFHKRLNADLAQHKTAWSAQVEEKFRGQMAELETKIEEYENRDKTEQEKLAGERDKLASLVASQSQQLFNARWQLAVGEAQRQAAGQGTHVIPHFITRPELTGKETPTEMAEKAQAAIEAARQVQDREFKAHGIGEPQQAPGTPPPPGMPPTAGPGWTPPPGPVPPGDNEMAWKMFDAAVQPGQALDNLVKRESG